MTNRKPRGRPIGSGINDEPILEQIAHRIVRDARRRPTTVYKELDDKWTEASVRRIQVKWKLSKVRLLAVAKARLAVAQPARKQAREIAGPRCSSAARLPVYLGALSERGRDLSFVSQALRAQSQLEDLITGGSARRLARDFSVATHMARALNGPFTQAARAAQMMDGTMRMARDLEEFQKRVDRMLGLHRY